MSILPKESIEVIAQSIGINNLSPDVALALAPDVEYRLREVMQEAIKCMRHSRRTRMTPDDVDGSLSIKNVEGSWFGGRTILSMYLQEEWVEEQDCLNILL